MNVTSIQISVLTNIHLGSVTYDNGGIREVGWGHLTVLPGFYWPGDASGLVFPDSDSSTGIGVTSSPEKVTNMYLRNSSTGHITKWTFGYGSVNNFFWQPSTSDVDLILT